MPTFEKWVSVWGNAVSIAENRPESFAKDITLRYPITSPFAGNQIRLTFDNYCGTEPITLSEVTILLQNTFFNVTFSDKKSITIPAGDCVTSDALAVSVAAYETFMVNIYLGDYTQMRSSVFVSGPLSNQAQYAIGNQSHVLDFSIMDSRKTNIVYFLSNVSIFTEKENSALVCYGDSITAQSWPDYLTLRCKEEGYSHTSIIRRATSGSRILREYNCITYESYGLMGAKRFCHEVPTDGADTVLIQQGINDIIHPVGTDVNPFRPMSDLPTLTELTDGLKWYIEQARKLDYKVYVGTLLPIEGWRTYAPFREDLKNAFNDWIRTTTLIDGCIDFAAATGDPENAKAFAPGFDSGDHLHPSELGYKAMASAIPAKLLH